jgi:hypothetical protein
VILNGFIVWCLMLGSILLDFIKKNSWI